MAVVSLPSFLRIVTYVSSVADNAPPHLSAAGALISTSGKHPVILCYATAPTKQLAREKLTRFWEDGAEKERAKAARAEAAGVRMREAAEARRAAKPAAVSA